MCVATIVDARRETCLSEQLCEDKCVRGNILVDIEAKVRSDRHLAKKYSSILRR